MSKGRVPEYLRSCVAGPLSFSTLACSSVRDPGGSASFLHADVYYPDNAFPLPFMDSMLDVVARHESYSFLDGFSGYNQVHMHPDDQEKTAFVTE